MALELVELRNDEEFHPLMATLYDAYSHPFNAFWNMFKGESGEECTARYTQWHNADPTSRWIYVKDTKTGQIVGGTQWNIHDKNPFKTPPPPLSAYWIQEGSALRDITEQALNGFLDGRPPRMNRPHLLIQWCGTHSQHRRQGAAMMMMRWGTQKADEMGVDAFVEATDAGFPLYSAAGFVSVDDIWADAHKENPSEEWLHVKKQLQLPMHGTYMWRPPGGKYEKGITRFPWEENVS